MLKLQTTRTHFQIDLKFYTGWRKEKKKQGNYLWELTKTLKKWEKKNSFEMMMGSMGGPLASMLDTKLQTDNKLTCPSGLDER